MTDDRTTLDDEEILVTGAGAQAGTGADTTDTGDDADGGDSDDGDSDDGDDGDS